jgi:hypothetical protein
VKEKNKKESNLLKLRYLFVFIVIVVPERLFSQEHFGGSVSTALSYDTNVSASFSEEGGGKGFLKNYGDMAGDLTANIYSFPHKYIYLDYLAFLSYPFQNSEFSLFFHILEAAYQVEFDHIDISAGLEFNHTVLDLSDASHSMGVEPYFEIFHYRSDVSIGIYRTSFGYKKALDSNSDFYEGYKISSSYGEILYFFDNKSSAYLDFTASLFILDSTSELFDLVTVEKKNSHFSLSQYLRLKFGTGIFDIIPGIRYEFSYFLENDIWVKFSDNNSKRRIDHLISPFIQIVFNVLDYFSISAAYRYYNNISTLGASSADYYDYNYDRHKISLELAVFF